MFSKNNFISKIKRTTTSFLPVARNRQGNCSNCGKCCSLPNKCLFFKETKNSGYCTVYNLRPLVCRKYPRTKHECVTLDSCGFDFGE